MQKRSIEFERVEACIKMAAIEAGNECSFFGDDFGDVMGKGRRSAAFVDKLIKRLKEQGLFDLAAKIDSSINKY